VPAEKNCCPFVHLSFWLYHRTVFFNLFAAAEPYKCDNHSRNPMYNYL